MLNIPEVWPNRICILSILRSFLSEDFWPEWAAPRWFSLEQVAERLMVVDLAVDAVEAAGLAYAATEEVLSSAVVYLMVPEDCPYAVMVAAADLVQDSWAIHQVSPHRWPSPARVSHLADHLPPCSQPEALLGAKTDWVSR